MIRVQGAIAGNRTGMLGATGASCPFPSQLLAAIFFEIERTHCSGVGTMPRLPMNLDVDVVRHEIDGTVDHGNVTAAGMGAAKSL